MKNRTKRASIDRGWYVLLVAAPINHTTRTWSGSEECEWQIHDARDVDEGSEVSNRPPTTQGGIQKAPQTHPLCTVAARTSLLAFADRIDSSAGQKRGISPHHAGTPVGQWLVRLKTAMLATSPSTPSPRPCGFGLFPFERDSLIQNGSLGKGKRTEEPR
eukprot:scaffold932_cov328-Pavlova_lutheri.AAC.45